MVKRMPATGIVAAVLVTLAPVLEAQQRGAGAGDRLRAVDSVRVAESDTLFLARPFDLVVGPTGHYFVVDGGEARVVEITPSGRIVRVFGRRGRGPGELLIPESATIGGDSLLAVMDNGQKLVVTYSVATGMHRGSFLLRGWLPTLGSSRGQLLAGVLEVETGTAVVRFTATGERLGAEGILPPVIRRHPELRAGFGLVTFTESEDGVFAAYEVSQSLYRWQKGSRVAEEIPLPVVRRKGVRPELFEELMRDPSKAAQLAYDRSVPIRLAPMGPRTLALVTLDGRLVQTGLVGTYSLTVIDLARGRVCPDIEIPTVQAPRPMIALVRDTVVVLEQRDDAAGQPLTTVRRLVVRTDGCDWLAIPGTRQDGRLIPEDHP